MHIKICAVICLPLLSEHNCFPESKEEYLNPESEKYQKESRSNWPYFDRQETAIKCTSCQTIHGSRARQ